MKPNLGERMEQHILVEVHLQSSSLGNKILIVAIVLDISERKNYTQKLEKTVALRTQELKEALVKEKGTERSKDQIPFDGFSRV